MMFYLQNKDSTMEMLRDLFVHHAQQNANWKLEDLLALLKETSFIDEDPNHADYSDSCYLCLAELFVAANQNFTTQPLKAIDGNLANVRSFTGNKQAISTIKKALGNLLSGEITSYQGQRSRILSKQWTQEGTIEQWYTYLNDLIDNLGKIKPVESTVEQNSNTINPPSDIAIDSHRLRQDVSNLFQSFETVHNEHIQNNRTHLSSLPRNSLNRAIDENSDEPHQEIDYKHNTIIIIFTLLMTLAAAYIFIFGSAVTLKATDLHMNGIETTATVIEIEKESREERIENQRTRIVNTYYEIVKFKTHNGQEIIQKLYPKDEKEKRYAVGEKIRIYYHPFAPNVITDAANINEIIKGLVALLFGIFAFLIAGRIGRKPFKQIRFGFIISLLSKLLIITIAAYLFYLQHETHLLRYMPSKYSTAYENLNGIMVDRTNKKPYTGRLNSGTPENFSIYSYKDGLLDGPYVYYVNYMLKEEGHWSKGEQDGTFRMYDERGILIDKAHFANGKRHGITEQYYPVTGNLRLRVNFKEGVFDGKLEIFAQDGTLKVLQEFKNGKQDGLTQTFDGKGSLTQTIEYKDGQPNGQYIAYYDNAQVKIKATLKNGEVAGEVYAYKPDGTRVQLIGQPPLDKLSENMSDKDLGDDDSNDNENLDAVSGDGLLSSLADQKNERTKKSIEDLDKIKGYSRASITQIKNNLILQDVQKEAINLAVYNNTPLMQDCNLVNAGYDAKKAEFIEPSEVLNQVLLLSIRSYIFGNFSSSTLSLIYHGQLYVRPFQQEHDRYGNGFSLLKLNGDNYIRIDVAKSADKDDRPRFLINGFEQNVHEKTHQATYSILSEMCRYKKRYCNFDCMITYGPLTTKVPVVRSSLKTFFNKAEHFFYLDEEYSQSIHEKINDNDDFARNENFLGRS